MRRWSVHIAIVASVIVNQLVLAHFGQRAGLISSVIAALITAAVATWSWNAPAPRPR